MNPLCPVSVHQDCQSHHTLETRDDDAATQLDVEGQKKKNKKSLTKLSAGLYERSESL